MTKDDTEFLLISEAVVHLEAGMFGGDVRRPKPVEDPKKQYPRASIGWGGHKEAAAVAVDAAIASGELVVYIFSLRDFDRPLQIPLAVLGQLIRMRGGLPDYAIRPSIVRVRDGLVTPELFDALSNSPMYLRRSQFIAWYEVEKSRRRWPSQRTSSKPRIGRPSKQTDELRTSIRARVEEQNWSADDGIAELVRLLSAKGAPKRHTLKRAVDQLYAETGDIRYRIAPRKRSRTTSNDAGRT